MKRSITVLFLLFVAATGAQEKKEVSNNTLAVRIADQEHDFDVVVKKLEDVLWYDKMDDVAYVDKVRLTGPPRFRQIPTGNAFHDALLDNDLVFHAYVFIPKKAKPESEDDETPAIDEAADDTSPEFVVAECCKPIPGDKVVGFRDPQSGKIIVHKATCEELNRLASQFGRNIIKDEIKWSQHKAVSYLSTIELRGIDRTGILLDLANVISRDFSINIREIGIQSHDGIFEGTLSLYVKNAESLSVVLENLRKIKGMESVKRNL